VRERTFSVVTTHYGDPFWVNFLIEQIQSQKKIIEIVVAQNYSNKEIELGWTKPYSSNNNDKRIKLLTKKNSKPDHASKQHTELLNWTIKNHTFSGDYIIFFDSDSFPIQSDWLKKIEILLEKNDAILSMNATTRFSVHVCFIVMKREILKEIYFNFENHATLRDGNHFELRIETGSDLAFQLLRKNYKTYLLEPQLAIKGSTTTAYLNKSILHIGSQSFVSRPDIKRNRETFFEYASFQFPKKIAALLVKHPKYLNRNKRELFLILLVKGKIPITILVQGIKLYSVHLNPLRRFKEISI
jgi:hypothetical protein